MYIVLASSRIYSARRQAITRDDDELMVELALIIKVIFEHS